MLNLNLSKSILPKPYCLADAWMQQRKRPNIYDCIKPVHTISRIFGVSLFKMRVDSNGQIENISVSVFDALWFISSIALNLMFSYFAQTSKRSAAKFGSSVVLLSDRFIWVLQLLMCLSSIILSLVNRKRFLKIVQDVIYFDKNVSYSFFHILTPM